MIRRWFSILFAMLCAASAYAESALMPASIDFNTPSLWGREIIYGLKDDGSYSTSGTRWYVGDGSNSSGAFIRRHQGSTTGYLQTENGSDVHRTLAALSRGESAGPSASEGHTLTEYGTYIDTQIALSAYGDQSEPRIFDRAKDKINCWLCVPVASNFSETNFIITAGSPNGPTNYVTDAMVVPGEEFHLMIKAVAEGSNCVFEVFVDDVQVRCGDVTRFPSMLGDSSDFARKLYSFGVNGAATVEKINFTGVDPREDPEYAVDDVSMLRERTEISIPGYVDSTGLYDFPLLVRVSESLIRGFYYSRVADDGSDIRFTDGNGKVIPHEIDTWNPDGESLIWVKVPYLVRDTKLTMHWSLKQGYSLPPIDSTEVWSDYIAVWHFGDITADGPMQVKDSSGHGFTAKVVGSGNLKVASTSIFGQAATITDGILQSPDYEATITVNGKFTFTGWYMAPEAKSTGWQMFGKKVNGTVSAADSEGWCGMIQGYSSFRIYFDGSDFGGGAVADMRSNWFFASLVYSSDSRAEVYLNGAGVSDTAATITPTATNFNLMARGGLFADELRISSKVRTSAWIKTEYDQANAEAYLAYQPAQVKDSDNYWVEEPYVKPTSVETADADTIVVYPGRPRFGSVILTYVDSFGNESFEKPTAAGAYKAVASVKEGLREGLRKELPFVIYDKRAYHKLAGYDRVMLFNSDHRSGSEVMLQGFHDVDSKTNKVWYHSSDEWEGIGDFVGIGSNHIYYEPETGNKLWEFRHARIGNLFRHDTKLASGMNFLPWGGTARRYDDSEMPATHQRDAGTLILQNRSTKTDPDLGDPNDPAAAYSPFYTKGIGTIYFDAVNAFCGYRNRLKVQICGSNDDEVKAGSWQDVKLDIFAICNGVYNEAMSTTGVDEVILEMNKSYGSTNWFYRVRANIDVNTPVRVRIVRTDDDWGYGDDDEGLVLVDNIIVSYPAMGVAISQYGAPADPNNMVLRGQRAPFDIAFPSAADLGSFHAQVKVDYLVNNTTEVDTSFIGALTFRYRWRYLDQIVGEWTELLLQPSADDPCRFVSAETLLGDGIGDIEYNCDAVVNAPFYEYCDYSGMPEWIWPDGFTERRGNVSISAVDDGVYSEERRSPALGTDYFIRLREGRSDYQGFRLHVRKASEKPAAAKVYEMRLSSDYTWRAFCPTFTNVTEGLLYRIESYNHQTATGCDYQYNQTFYCGSDQKEVPVNDAVTESDGWASIPCDGLTGYLMFQVEDNTRSLVIIHADYQNFNQWTDACSPIEDPYFVGTSSELPTSGVSRAALSYNDTFTNYTATVATNRLWEEHFNVEPSEEGEFPIGQQFIGNKMTPYGWSAANATWVCENFNQMVGDSIALQLMGGGFGSLLFPQDRNPYPRGLEVFSYNARLAQTYDIHSFNFYTGAGTTNDVYNLDNYTFATSLAMTLAGDSRYKHSYADFSGVGSVSLLAHYRESKGGYEFRVERVDETNVRLCLYKWLDDGAEPTLLGRSPVFPRYSIFSLDGSDEKCGVCFISCSNTVNSVRVTAGILSAGRMVQNENFSGRDYYKVSYEDFTATRLTTGTFGIGSKDCPAVFARPRLSRSSVVWVQDAQANINNFRYWTGTRKVDFPNEFSLIEGEEDYNAWNVYRSRIGIYEYRNPVGGVYNGFSAKIPEQKILIEISPHLKNNWDYMKITNVVKSFMFEEYANQLYIAEDVDIRLRTSEETTGADIVIDDLALRQWRGENYNDANNPDRVKFYDFEYGAPTNFVYTTAWIDDDTAAEISPMRTTSTEPSGVRSPLMDGLNGRGLGLGSFSFAYRNADPRARLLVQVATNGVSRNGLRDLTSSISGWTTVEVFEFDEMTEEELTGGILSCYLGLHGVAGVMRVIVDPALVDEAHNPSQNPNGDPNYGRIFITMAGAKDNPELDNGSWWGWNLRTTDDASKQILDDCTKSDTRISGLSYGLNNSIVSNVRIGDDYEQHMPFLQTPIFGRGVIGEVTFKARKYEAGDYPPTVTIYGTTSHDPEATDADFEYLGEILITSDRYEKYTFQAPISKSYTAFRLAVTGVDGITGDPGRYPESGRVRRVLIDEVAVFEAILARMGFCRTGAFRTGLDHNDPIPNMPDRAQQPLCEEAWGIQTELYAAQLSEKIDFKREPIVTFHWYVGTSPWGYDNWKNNAGANSAVLSHATGSNLVYRSSYITSPAAVVDSISTKGQVVQYSLEVVYYMEDQPDPLTNILTSAEWEKPSWYRGIDLNKTYKAWDSFAAYTILDTVPYGYAWINEVNIYDGSNPYNNIARTNQYVEIAVPREADLTGWKLRFITGGMGDSQPIYTNVVATFNNTLNGVIPTKNYSLGGASNYVFITVGNSYSCNAATKKDGTIDGVWSVKKSEYVSGQDQLKSDGVIDGGYPIGIELIRPSGVIEYQVVVIGTNCYAGIEYYEDVLSPTNFVRRLNSLSSDANWIFAGDDLRDVPGNGLSVTQQFALTAADWTYLQKTPGRINIGEYINPDHPIANGSSIVINADIVTSDIVHRLADTTNTTESIMVVVPKGSENGTNFYYTVGKWFEIEAISVTSGGKTKDYLVGAGADGKPVMLTVGQNCSNSVQVIARARINSKLRNEYGLNEKNLYTPAVIDWLRNNKTERGEFENDDCEIRPTMFMGLSGVTNRLMTLTEMYWLDIDPTVSNMYFIAGMVKPPTPVIPAEVWEKPSYTENNGSITNIQVGVYMAISNGNEKTMWAPYTLRGIEPGSSSAKNTANWTSVTFKVTAYLDNGLDAYKSILWLPLRDFTFKPGSFKEYQSLIEISDPHSKASRAYYQQWNNFPDAPIYYRWDINEDVAPTGVNHLEPVNLLKSVEQ